MEEDISDSISEVVNDSDHDTHASDGHKGWECKYCNEQFLRASDANMNTHLALNCKKAPLDIKQELLRKFPVPNQKSKTKTALDIITGVQPRIDSKFQVVNKMDSGQEELCHKALTRFFALSNDWLNFETARVTVAMEKELQNEKVCIKQILEDNNSALTPELRKLVQNRQFWANADVLAKILLPAKNAVKMVESKSTTTADVFLSLIQMANT
ncbi:13376_t:CDS:2 [Racocetra persica]|uniref:13376_t:CDS:1 n=1 Tax=Racocetra persica TaxID=160502 RepID=A0ACA9PY82_9GLOM|nr:13376_t:CDS:2 [Racocetra persica]